MIKVIGLGNTKGDISQNGIKAIKESSVVYLKTALTDTVTYFIENNIEYIALDYLYEEAEDFKDLDEKIIHLLLKNAKRKVALCVNGSGFEDRVVEELSKLTKIEIIPSAPLGAINKMPATSFIQMSAYDIINLKGFNYDTRIPLLIVDVDNKYVASEIKLLLSDILGDEEEILFNKKTIKVYELDRQHSYSYKTTIAVPQKDIKTKYRYNFNDLYAIMKILRGENGCEWDKAQDHASIRQNLIEEAYELVDAINNEDVENMIEESGDVLLQSIFHCVIGEDLGEYSVNDTITALCQKLVFRHPHIFGNMKANNKDEALEAWNSAKAKEKKYTNAQSKIDKLTKALPPFMKARKILSILKKEGKIEKNLQNDIEQLQIEIQKLNNSSTEEEIGKILLKFISVLHERDMDGEVICQKATQILLKEHHLRGDN